jgi:hypothetical protein
MSSPNNELSLPYAQQLNAWVIQRIVDHMNTTGKALPCTVVEKPTPNTVTVAFQVQALPGQTAVTFPNVTMAIAESIYVRLPVQVGELGVTFPNDTMIGNVTGFGGQAGQASVLSPPPNLAALVFVPVSNTGWPAPPDPEQVTITGPTGVYLRDTQNQNTLNLNSNGTLTINLGTSMTVTAVTEITLTAGGKSLIINSSGISVDGITWETHAHPYFPGSGTETDTGPPVA